MAHGPPPSEAGPSNSSSASPAPNQPSEVLPVPSSSTSVFQVQPSPGQQQSASFQYQNVFHSHSYATTLPHTSTSSSPASYSQYTYPQSWNSAWQSYSPSTSTPGAYQWSYRPIQHVAAAPSPARAHPAASKKRKAPSPSPPPSPPPPPFHNEWDRVVKEFLNLAGLTQALRGFEMDMIVMSPDWERKGVPVALKKLSQELSKLEKAQEGGEDGSKPRPLDDRKLSHVRFAPDIEPQTPTSVNKDISTFLTKNRARNDASNCAEFLLSLAEKRRKLQEDAKARNEEIPVADIIASCARTDAKTQDRDMQMKYDIARNEDGPLRKTMKGTAQVEPSSVAPKAKVREDDDGATGEQYPPLDERLRNIETHLAVRYVPSPPRSLLDRLKFVEDHIIHLEKQFPPWAALHFNQPHRGWPPPPRATPIIVPPQMRSSAPSDTPTQSHASIPSAVDAEETKSKGKGKANAKNKSSLHRAVMERLEVQKAMNDLADVRTEDHNGQK